MKKLFLTLAFFAVFFSQAQPHLPTNIKSTNTVVDALNQQKNFLYTYTGKVVKIKDGDTVTVLDSLNNSNTVRFYGVDAPEKKQEFGNVAKKFVSQEIFGKTVTVSIVSIDIFKRPVGHLFYNDSNGKPIDISEQLLIRGLAWQFYDKSDHYKRLQAEAVTNRLGLWIIDNPIEPSIFRHPKKPSKTKVAKKSQALRSTAQA